MQPIAERWHESVILADGAMGTLLFSRDAVTSCVELFNLTAPDAVEQAHGEYVAAGARLIETNTFAANRLKLRAHDLANRVAEINLAGVEIARRAGGTETYVAASIGPLGALLEPIGSVGRDEARDVFVEQAAAIASASPDVLLLETFGSADEALIAVAAIKKAASSLPLVVSLSVVEDGRTPDGDLLLPAFLRLRAAGADAVGINCAVGPQAVFDALAPIIAQLDCPVSVMPNAGYPHRVDDRTVYESAPAYFARFARQFVDIGANIIGGCCGTTPEHIAAMAPEVAGERPHRRIVRPPTTARVTPRERTVARHVTAFERDFGRRFMVTVEISPPRGADAAPVVAAARTLAAAGVDAVHVGDTTTARAAMSGLTTAHLIMRDANLPAILHVSCRDRNLVGLQSELLGAAALGIPAVVALTGDPSNIGDFPKTTSVFDVTALGLTKILRALNDGHDLAGTDIAAPTRFRIGAAVNAFPRDLGAELARLDEKVAAGADFVVTQPVFDAASIAPFAARASGAGIPVFVGILPLRSFANAEYLHNEVPGMQVPAGIRERLRTSHDEANEGSRIARDLLVELAQVGTVAGVYVMPQERYDEAASLIVDALRAIPANTR